MRVQQQPGFVLHQNPYSETSLVLEIFTPEHGRIGLLAKGARRPGNRSRAFLKPFQPLLLGWSGRGELPVLTGAEPQEASHTLEGQALYCGFYLNELLVRLLHRHDPHPGLYRAYQECLVNLCAGARHDATLRIFEKRLLQEVGYGLVLDHDIGDNSPVSPDALYDYVFDRGPVRLHSELNIRVQGVRLRGTTLLALAREELDEPVALREAKALMRTALARHLGDRPLTSRELFLRRPAVVDLQEEERCDKTGS